MAVLVRSDDHAHRPTFHEQMPIGWRDVDAAVLEWLVVDRVSRRKRPTARQNNGQRARRFFRNVEHRGDRRVQIRRQPADELDERPDSARGCSGHDDVAPAHVNRHRQKPANDAESHQSAVGLRSASSRSEISAVSAARYSDRAILFWVAAYMIEVS